MYKCFCCGRTFEEPKTIKEYRGEYWGRTVYEDVNRCPHCEGDFEEAVQCSNCKEWFFDCEIEDNLCDDCIEIKLSEFRYDVKACAEVLNEETTEININPVFAMLFDKNEIEEILLKELLEFSTVDCDRITEEYRDWFLKRISEENADE